MGWVLDRFGSAIAGYLEKPLRGYEPFTPSDPDGLRASLRPGDVLLVEGNNRISGVIKYLTQSTWSHAAPSCRLDGRKSRSRRRSPCTRRGRYVGRRRVGSAVEISRLSHAGVPAGR